MATTYHYKNGSGNQATTYPFTFPYLKEADVKVQVFNTTTDTWDLKTPTTDYILANATSIQFTVAGNPASGTNNIYIYRDTATDELAATFYPGSAIRSADLNDNYTQNLYTTQESTNTANDAINNSRQVQADGTYKSAWTQADDAKTEADNAVASAATANQTADNAVASATTANQTADAAVVTADAVEDTVEAYVADATGLKGDGVSPNPKGVAYAVNQVETYVADSTGLKGDGQGGNPQGVKYAVDEAVAAVASAAQANLTAGNAVTSAANANTTAGNAVTSATNANTTAANAVASAATANTTAGNAVTTANDAETKADTAIVTANTASTTAGNAETTANAASAKADDVEDTVELYVADSNGLRGDGTDPVTDPQGVKYAVRLANEASASVAASAIYKVVADLATLATDYPLTGNQPSPPGPDPNNLAPTPDGTFVQITDSTGISLSNGTWTATNGVDFSGAGSFPNGFDGDSQLTLRVKVSNSTAGSESYVAQEYYANDPEARYGEDRKVIVESSQTISANYTIQTTMNAHSVGPVTIAHNGTDLTYNPENHAQPYVATNAATAGNTVTIPVNSTWLIS